MQVKEKVTPLSEKKIKKITGDNFRMGENEEGYCRTLQYPHF